MCYRGETVRGYLLEDTGPICQLPQAAHSGVCSGTSLWTSLASAGPGQSRKEHGNPGTLNQMCHFSQVL